LVTGRPPILLLTTENVVVEKINPAGAFQKVKTGFDVFPLSSITKLSSLEKGFFEFQLNDGRSIRARRIGSWTGIKDSQKFHDALTSALAHA
jgi:hypothetical protein